MGVFDNLKEEFNIEEAESQVKSVISTANEKIEEIFNKKEIPFIYRIHEKPEEERINMLAKILHNLDINFKTTYTS